MDLIIITHEYVFYNLIFENTILPANIFEVFDHGTMLNSNW